MEVDEALQFIDRALASMQGSRQDHAVALQAIQTLRDALEVPDDVDSV